MKFAWKVTAAAVSILVLSMGIGSYLIISLSFRSALDREIDLAMEEMQMLRISYEAVCDARGVTLENISERSRGLQRTLAGDPYFADRQFRISTQDGAQVYSTLKAGSDQELLSHIDSRSTGYIVRSRQPGQVLVYFAGPVALPDGFLYLETVRDISSLFADRETHFQVYRWILLIVAAAGSAVLFLLSYLLTRPIRTLGKVTTQLAQGDYTPRAVVSGGDEISELAAHFNHMADAIEKNVQELEDAARRQEDFTASFVHELKTPLTSIIGYADMLRSHRMDSSASFKAANYIFSEGKRLENLSLSLMSMLVVGHSEADAKPVSMAMLCRQAAQSSQPAMAARNLALSVTAEEGVLEGDAALLQTLIQNLLDNARKASDPGGSIALTGTATSSGYRIQVTDQGQGIPAEELSKITEAFYMVDKSRSRAEGGAGLGLALCKEIAALHRGALSFESRLGGGTTVTVELEGIGDA